MTYAIFSYLRYICNTNTSNSLLHIVNNNDMYMKYSAYIMDTYGIKYSTLACVMDRDGINSNFFYLKFRLISILTVSHTC